MHTLEHSCELTDTSNQKRKKKQETKIEGEIMYREYHEYQT